MHHIDDLGDDASGIDDKSGDESKDGPRSEAE